MPRYRNNISPEQLLADYSKGMQSPAGRLRRLVKDTIPEAEEKTYPGWRAIGCRHPKAGYIDAIFLHRNMVKLGFEHGTKLPDPHGLLKPGASAGKQVRYLEIVEESDTVSGVIRQLIEAAVELGHEL